MEEVTESTKEYYLKKVSSVLESHNLEIIRWFKEKGQVKAKFKCKVCGDEFDKGIQSLINSKKPCISCRNQEKYNKYIKEFNIIHNNKYVYLGFRTIFASKRKQLQVRLKCKDCGNSWWMLVANHKKGVGCSPCAIKNLSDTLEEIINKVKNKYNLPYTILRLFEKDGNKRIELKCEEHGNFDISKVSLIAHGCTCPICDLQNRKTSIKYNQKSYEEALEDVRAINPNIKVLTSKDRYANIKSSVELECKICGHKFKNSIDNIKRGNGCSECAKLKMKSYNPKIAERYKESWLKEPLKLYIIECFTDKERFYKIGVTSREIKSRFSGLPYKYKTLKVLETNKYQGVLLESHLQNKYEDYSYVPKNKFGGYTECFSYIPPIEEIEHEISKFKKDN